MKLHAWPQIFTGESIAAMENDQIAEVAKSAEPSAVYLVVRQGSDLTIVVAPPSLFCARVSHCIHTLSLKVPVRDPRTD